MSIRGKTRSKMTNKANIRKSNTKTGRGPWRDTVTRPVVHDDYVMIIVVGIAIVITSSRAFRQRALVSVMRLVDQSAAQRDFDIMPETLAGHDATPSAATDEAANATSETSHT